MGQPGFWDDQEAAATTSAAHARAQRRLEMFRGLESDVADLGDLAEMAAEDEEMAAELGTQLGSVERRLAELEEARLFSGEYDAGDAVVTVHAGAGGTDSQDWAEILLRMYLRWAERRGFDGRDEGGLAGGGGRAEVGDLHRPRRERLRPLRRRARRPPPGPDLALRLLRRAATPASPRSTSGRWSTRASRSRSTTADLRIDTYRASGAGGQHVNKTDSAVRITHLPTGVVVQCQNERSQTQNKAVAMQLLRSKLIELEERKRAEELAKARGEVKDVAWGSQIRSYVLHPYTMVKDHRTEHEVGDVQRVLDGDIDEFVRDYLNKTAAASAELVAAAGLSRARRRRPSREGLLVLHHGRGTDESDLLGLADALDPERRLRVVTPRAPLSLPGSPGYHWYLVPRVGYPDHDTFHAARAALAELHDQLWEETGVGPERTVLGGFSMGAVMSYAMGLGAERPAVAGILAFSGFVPSVDGLASRRFGDRQATRVFIAHGRRDPVIEVGFAQRARDLLEAGGLDVAYRESELGHQIDPAPPGDATAWLGETLPSVEASECRRGARGGRSSRRRPTSRRPGHRA